MGKYLKIKRGFILRKIANSDVVIPIGENVVNFNGLITLNKSAAFLFRLLNEGKELTDLIGALRKEYEISEELAKEDTEQFILRLEQAGMLANQ